MWVMCLSMSKSGITKGPMSLSPFIITATYQALTMHKHFKNLVPHRPYNSPTIKNPHRYYPYSRNEEAEAWEAWAACIFSVLSAHRCYFMLFSWQLVPKDGPHEPHLLGFVLRAAPSPRIWPHHLLLGNRMQQK